jgi:hypothetical protein
MLIVGALDLHETGVVDRAGLLLEVTAVSWVCWIAFSTLPLPVGRRFGAP